MIIQVDHKQTTDQNTRPDQDQDQTKLRPDFKWTCFLFRPLDEDK